MARPPLHSRGPTPPQDEREGIQKLIEQARSDPKFFHALVFDTESAISRLDYLSRREKAQILAVDPERLVSGLAGVGKPGDVEICGVSCAGSCGGTCGASCIGSCGASCGGSCDNSCGGTCGGSCGSSCQNSCADSCVASCVGSGDLERGDWATLPADAVIRDQITREIHFQIQNQSFSRFQR